MNGLSYLVLCSNPSHCDFMKGRTQQGSIERYNFSMYSTMRALAQQQLENTTESLSYEPVFSNSFRTANTKLFSVTNNSVGSRTAAASRVGHKRSAHVAGNGRL